MRHNNVRDLWAELCKKVHRNVYIEPTLAPIPPDIQFKNKSTSTEAGARSDVLCRGFYTEEGMQNNHFDINVYNAFAPSTKRATVEQTFKAHEMKKCLTYCDRINIVDQGSFTPLVMSNLGGMGKEMEVALSRLASKIADRKNEVYADVIRNLRLHFSYCLAKVSLITLRGSRVQYQPHEKVTDFELVNWTYTQNW